MPKQSGISLEFWRGKSDSGSVSAAGQSIQEGVFRSGLVLLRCLETVVNAVSETVDCVLSVLIGTY